MILLKVIILFLSLVTSSYLLAFGPGVCSDSEEDGFGNFEQNYKTCDPAELYGDGQDTPKEEKSKKLCYCLKDVAETRKSTVPKNLQLEKTSTNIFNKEISRGLRLSLRNLLSISQNFHEYTKTKTHAGNLLPVNNDGTPDTSKSCDLMVYNQKIKENFKKMAKSKDCPADEATIRERYKEIFQTYPEEESKLFSYYTDFKNEYKDSNGKRSCLDRKDFINLRSLGQGSREASSLLLNSQGFEHLREQIKERSTKENPTDEQRFSLNGFDENPLLNLASTDKEFFNAYQQKLKEMSKDDQSLIIRDEELYKLAFDRINENCHKLMASVNQYLCEEVLFPDLPADDMLNLLKKRADLDTINSENKDDKKVLENFADYKTYEMSCKKEYDLPEHIAKTLSFQMKPLHNKISRQLFDNRIANKKKSGIVPTPEHIQPNIEDILEDSLLFKSIDKKSIDEENQEIASFQEALCLPGIESPLKEADFDKMIGKFLSDRPDLQKYFSKPNVVKVGEASISFNPKTGELDLKSSNPDKLPYITLADWKKIEADLISKGVIKDAKDSEILFTALDMRMNRNIEDTEDLKYKVQQNNPEIAKNLTTTDIKKTVDGNPPIDTYRRWGIPEDFSKTIQAENQILIQNKSTNLSTGQVTDLMYGAKTYAQVQQEAADFNNRKAVYTPSAASPKSAPNIPPENPNNSSPGSSSNNSVAINPTSGSFNGAGRSSRTTPKSHSPLSDSRLAGLDDKDYGDFRKRRNNDDSEYRDLERKFRNAEREFAKAKRNKKKANARVKTPSPQGGGNNNWYTNPTPQSGGNPSQKIGSVDTAQTGSTYGGSIGDELSSNENAGDAGGGGGGSFAGGSRSPAAEDSGGIPSVDPSKVNGLKKNLLGGAMGVEEPKPETEEERRKRLKLKNFEYPYIVPHGLLNALGGIENVVFFMELEGMRFKTLERVDDINLETGEESFKYFLRVYDFVPGEKFKSFQQIFKDEKLREENHPAFFVYTRSPSTLKQTQEYALGTQEISKEEVTTTFANSVQDDIIEDKEIKLKILDTQSKYLRKKKTSKK